MEGNWRPTQSAVEAEASMASSAIDASSAVTGGDWRSQLQPGARQRVVSKIMETLKKHLPTSVPEGLNELRKIAIRFEEKIYTAATNQTDYLRKISLKLLSMEAMNPSAAPINPGMPNPVAVNQNLTDPGSISMQSQPNNPGQSLLPVPDRQSILPQKLQNNTTSAVQGSLGMAPILPPMSGLGQSNISGVSHASNLQNLSGISQNSVNNSIMQGAQPDISTNSQRQLPGRQQQQIISQQQQQQQQPQQSRNPLLYQQQLQQQLLNQKLQHSSLLQHPQQQQQQSLLQPNQMQSTQASLMQTSSSLQLNQSNIQQTQLPSTRTASQPGIQQNKIQQSVPSLLQNSSISRQQQVQSLYQQAPSAQQQSAPMSQQSTLSNQQQLMGQQGNMSNMQQNHLLGQQNDMADIQQQRQRLPIQQNNLLSMQHQQLMNQQTLSLQQQLGSQSKMSGLQQQHQLLGSIPSVSNMQPHQQALVMQKNAAQHQQQQQQQQNQQSSLLLQSQSPQSQNQLSQQQLMSQYQSRPSQLQQHLLMQQQSSSLQREMQQRLQSSGPVLQAQNAMEQKPFTQAPTSSAESTAQTGEAGSVDWREECYQKLKSIKELYLAELTDFHQKITLKLQQQEALIPPGKQSGSHEKLKSFRHTLEFMLSLLQINKNNIPVGVREKLPLYEKQILSVVAANRAKKMSPQVQGQQQFPHPNAGNSQSIAQQQQSHVPQLQLLDNNANQVQQIMQGSGTSLQPSGSSSMQHVSMPSSTTHQSMQNMSQPNSNIDSAQGSSFNSVHPGAIGSGQQGGLGSLQSSMSQPPKNNVNSLPQSAANSLQNNGPMQLSSGVLQQQHLKQERQPLLQPHEMKQQLHQRHIQQQQLIQQQQRQQSLQHHQPLQQHMLQQQKQQQASQLSGHQAQQLHSMNELNELKARQGSGIKPGLCEYSAGQRHNYYNQQLKSGNSYPVSSPQNLHVSSPQVSHHSPQIDQNGLLSSFPKAKAPTQSANSPLAVTPSTPFAPSPIPVDSEKPLSTISSSGLTGHQQPSVAPPESHPLAVNTPGISASPLLAECTIQDGNQANVPATSKTTATEMPIDRLIKVVRSLTPKTLGTSVGDIGSVVSMIDRRAGSSPGNGSRAAVGEDLVAMTKCRLQARNFMSQDGSATAKKMKRNTSAMPLNNVSSPGSFNDTFKQLHGFESSELESTATSRIKRFKPEVNYTLLEEIREINQKLIDTVVDVSDKDSDSVAVASESGEGTVVKCSYTAVALSQDLRAQFASAQMSPIMPLRLLVPSNYPKGSPVLFDNLPVEPSREFEDLSTKAKSKFSIALRSLSQPMSLGEMAETWDACARKVILEYAQQTGGGSFSAKYGSWEYCVGA